MTLLRKLGSLMGEALWGMLASPRRLVGAGLAAGLGIGLYVAVGTLTQSGRLEVSASFDALAATQVRIWSSSGLLEDAVKPEELEQRIEYLRDYETVRHADWITQYNDQAVSDGRPGGTRIGAPVIGMSGGSLPSLATTITGRDLPSGAPPEATPMALVGTSLMADLGLGTVDGIRTITVADSRFVIAGTIESEARREIRNSVVILRRHGEQMGLGIVGDTITVRVDPATATPTARIAPLIIMPEVPEQLVAVAAPDPELFRRGVERDVELALLAVSAVAVIVGGLTLANSLAVSVMSRTSELGLRRALGATSADIFSLVMIEGLLIGLIGGIAGASAGLAGALIAADYLEWTRVVDPALPAIGAAAGAGLGLITSLPSARRATRLEPVDALRSA